MCLLAAKSVPNCDAIDGVFTDVKNSVGFSDESEEALRMGFDGKLTLHPDQVRLLLGLSLHSNSLSAFKWH